ncbi:class I SAM-dependent methyltransferase [Nocardia speluncae]|uniref:S-adenosyl-L-methionine-dependent methyltransferase n=1 Tax=Nocardia speluncae TaxID=419477 RepID=A0A846X8Q2_9NOCA|nr:class I SAM-dependent methyltransferase [Nocardia speluncae]NKY31847.1 class I SAM-dependent methyltransferase [Nocardia speluncae]
MDIEGPSRTALVTAYARAYHQIFDRPRILTDPLATRLLGVDVDALAELGRPPVDSAGGGGPDILRLGVGDRPRRLFFAARARFAEDCVADAAAAGVGQVVVLGAGLDTFAYRNPHPGLRVFEVDHPATQAWKHQRLAESGIDVPDRVTFVPVDFETDTLAARLEATGFRRADPAVFVWLGVVYYLTPDAVRATLEYVVGCSEPVEVIFDYLQAADTGEDRAQLRARAHRAAAVGEPWFSYFAPDDIAAELRALGFTAVDDRPAVDVIAGYLDGSAEFAGEPPEALRPVRILRASRSGHDDDSR